MPSAYFQPLSGSVLSSSGAASGEPMAVDLIPAEVAALARRRAELKAQKLFAEADVIRAEITALGYEVKDRKAEFDIYRL